MKIITIPISDIIVLERDRRDYGDLEDLADSITRLGLMQPPAINASNELVWGGRRLAACKLLNWTTIPVVIRETIDEAELAELETEENVRRKNYNWREMINATVRLHRLHARRAALASREWTHAMTGELISYSRTFVFNCLDLVNDINTPAFAHCEGITDAVKLKARLKEDEALKLLASRTNLQGSAFAPTPDPSPEPVPSDPSHIPITSPDYIPVQLPPRTVTDVNLSSRLIHGDFLDVAASIPDGFFHHIITDPPYGIDMDNLDQGGASIIDTSRVDATHDVADNLALFAAIFPIFYRITKPNAFVAICCDIMNWHILYNHAIAAGFRVQRWPIVWHKTHRCKNQCAQYNTTKDTELVMLCRKPNTTLPAAIGTSVIVCAKDPHASNPFAKPFEFWSFLIEALSITGQTILDPFAGEGSSTLTLMKTYRKAYAIEKDELHFNTLLENVKTYYHNFYGKDFVTFS
jgi:ParB family transcriptional regulator, chromosome partitioning protein